MLNGINCGGCAKGVRAALMAVEGVADVLAENKKDTGVHPNRVVVTGVGSARRLEAAARAALAALDAGRGKFTVVEPGAPPQPYEEFPCSPARARAAPASAAELGFTSHVFRARRPFHEARLLALCDRWDLPSKDVCFAQFERAGRAAAAPPRRTHGADDAAPFAGVLRSKGSVWLDSAPAEQVAWSHAGRHFRLTFAGGWWCTLPEPVMRQCLPSPASFAAERAHFEGEDGDRRQELVFIGTSLDRAAIDAALSACLCTDDELAAYRAAAAAACAPPAPFRFGVGDRVECNVGADEWKPGAVVAHHYREPEWPPEEWSPYQVQLDDGLLVYAPDDEAESIRAESPG